MEFFEKTFKKFTFNCNQVSFIIYLLLISFCILLNCFKLINCTVSLRSASSKFEILTVIPKDKANQLSNDLRDALTNYLSVRSDFKHDQPLIVFTPLPVGNDSQRLFESVCDAFEIHNPSMILSFLEPQKTFYLRIIARKVNIPILTLTSEYQESGYVPKSMSSQTLNSADLSLDSSIFALSEATFELLQLKRWLDAVLLIDDTLTSDLFRYRLTRLCQTHRQVKNFKLKEDHLRKNGDNYNSQDYRTFDSVWSRLKVIQLSKNLLHNEFYLQLSELQTSSRRVILVHCDDVTIKRVIDIAFQLGLFKGQKIWILLDGVIGNKILSSSSVNYYGLPKGMIALHQRPLSYNNLESVFKVVQVIVDAANSPFINSSNLTSPVSSVSCWRNTTGSRIRYSQVIYRELGQILKPMSKLRLANYKCSEEELLKNHKLPSNWHYPIFDVLNLVASDSDSNRKVWLTVGNITRYNSTLSTIQFIEEDKTNTLTGPSPSKHRFRVVTGIAPPFVHLSTRLANETCLTGVACLKANTSQPEVLVSMFTDFHSKVRVMEGKSYIVQCCSGIAIDLLNSISRDLNFVYDLYLVSDGLFGISRSGGQWDGITADLVSGAAHLTFSAYSVTSDRVNAIDYSVPFFYSGVSCLARSQFSEVPYTAFLIPFSYQLWFAIFASLHATAIAAAIYEWLSPFGLNPWGRQRTKNFTLASALWVMWSLLFSHLVAFKAPKSWPNKVLINLWGCFSVIFLATYTANIAAHFAGLFSIEEINDFHDGTLMSLRTGVARSSASEGYIKKENMALYGHVQKYMFKDIEEGLQRLRNETLQVLIGDTAILDYVRANEPGCNLKLLGDSIFEDAYAVGMQKGFLYKNAISDLILKYNTYGYLDQLQRKWYGRVPCLENSLNNLNIPKPLSIRAVAGVFIMLGIGLLFGIVILLIEHFAFKYVLPTLRNMPKETYWKSPNLMFFSQKLYRFINKVELVSPHHSAKEIMSSLRTGQITSLFQKSLKKKAKEDARRRKSKSQFFEMIQEVRKVVQEKKDGRRRSSDQLDGLTDISITTPYSLKHDSLLDERDLFEKNTYKASAIRWKEPSTSSEERPLHEPILLPLNIKPVSRLKNTEAKVLKPEKGVKKKPTSKANQIDTLFTTKLIEREKSGHDQNKLKKTDKIRENVSLSLENIVSDKERTVKAPRLSGDKQNSTETTKTLSLDDLSFLKQQLSLPTSEIDKYWQTLSQSSKDSMLSHSPKPLKSAIDQLRVQSMTKEDIIAIWRTSEKELLASLQDALRQKKALEEKVVILQWMLMKPS